ncbi:hypothetical protein N9K06_00455 [Omnitrophica bacterium]|nr:hypothetical protein [Candidatus Omnitrophota bacterium]
MAEKKKTFRENCLYFDMSKQERDSAVRYLLGVIINSRRECNFPSNYYTFDEDVNVYLAHLLFAMSLPEYHEMAEPYLSMNSSDILKWVRATEDRTIRYFIFKVNADHILVHSAIFGDLEKNERRPIFKRSAKHYKELAKLYYDQAAAYHKRIYRRKTGVGDVLQKLSQYFDPYQNLLKVVRRDYFDFVNSFRDQVFDHFKNELEQYEVQFQKKNKMDVFLDLYARWLETKDPQLAEQISKLVAEIEKIDPGFRFNLGQDPFDDRDDPDNRKIA